MPMITEDIITGLNSLAASDNMNHRQRDIMTEAAGLIKFQQYRVDEAERKQKDAEAIFKQIDVLNDALRTKLAGVIALQTRFRDQLLEMSAAPMVASDNVDPEEDGNVER